MLVVVILQSYTSVLELLELLELFSNKLVF